MGIMVYSLVWVMQDLYHQPYLLSPDLWIPSKRDSSDWELYKGAVLRESWGSGLM